MFKVIFYFDEQGTEYRMEYVFASWDAAQDFYLTWFYKDEDTRTHSFEYMTPPIAA